MDIKYPKTRKQTVTDTYFGIKVDDPYRWLEDDNSPETKAWVDAQNKVTEGYLSSIPFRKALKNRLTSLVSSGLSARASETSVPDSQALTQPQGLFCEQGESSRHSGDLLHPNQQTSAVTSRPASFRTSTVARQPAPHQRLRHHFRIPLASDSPSVKS